MFLDGQLISLGWTSQTWPCRYVVAWEVFLDGQPFFAWLDQPNVTVAQGVAPINFSDRWDLCQ
jgi:hypothetical protein